MDNLAALLTALKNQQQIFAEILQKIFKERLDPSLFLTAWQKQLGVIGAYQESLSTWLTAHSMRVYAELMQQIPQLTQDNWQEKLTHCIAFAEADYAKLFTQPEFIGCLGEAMNTWLAEQVKEKL